MPGQQDRRTDAKPLAGLRVLELARILAGPWAGQILADLGAEVIKVERAGAGDDTRQWGPPFVADGAAAYFHGTNRGKKSVALDFEKPDDLEKVRQLARRSDILIENFKVGGLDKYGLSYADLKKENPRLIYCSITGFGQDGPYAKRAGYDFMIQGMGGIMDLTGSPDGSPTKIGVAFADVFTGVYSATAILAALERRHRTHEGAYIDMALLDTQVAVLANQAMNYLVSGVPPKRLGNSHPNIVPYDVFPVSDGHIIIAVGNDSQFGKLCQVLDVAPLATDARFKTNADRVKNRHEICGLIAARSKTFTRADLLKKLEGVGVPAGPINSVADVFDDPQVLHRALQRTFTDGGVTIPSVAGPMVIDGVRMVAEKASPRLGADTQSVLAALQQDRFQEGK